MYEDAVSHILDQWTENEAMAIPESPSVDEFSPLLVARTRRHVVRPVRKLLHEVDPFPSTQDFSGYRKDSAHAHSDHMSIQSSLSRSISPLVTPDSHLAMRHSPSA